MIIPPERELINRPLNLNVPPSLEEQVERFASEYAVKKSVAVRFILSSFLSDYFGKTKDIRTLNEYLPFK